MDVDGTHAQYGNTVAGYKYQTDHGSWHDALTSQGRKLNENIGPGGFRHSDGASSSGTYTPDLSFTSHYLALTENTTVAAPDASSGYVRNGHLLRFHIVSDGTHSVTWASIYGGTIPAVSATSGRHNFFEFEFHATVGKWFIRGVGGGNTVTEITVGGSTNVKPLTVYSDGSAYVAHFAYTDNSYWDELQVGGVATTWSHENVDRPLVFNVRLYTAAGRSVAFAAPDLTVAPACPVQVFGDGSGNVIRLGDNTDYMQLIVGGVLSRWKSAGNRPLYFEVNGVDALEVAPSASAGETRILVYDETAAALVRVSRGASDSGGAGFRLLRVPN